MSELCDLLDKLTGCGVNGIPSKDPKGQYTRIVIPLNESFTDKEYHLAGSFLGIVSIKGSASCKIKLDFIHNGLIDLREIQTIRSHFNKIYVSTNGYGGELTIYICQSMETSIATKSKSAWMGQIFSAKGNIPDDPMRLEEASCGFHLAQVVIRNGDYTDDCEVGWVPSTGDLPSRADFLDWSYRVIPKMELILYNVDPASIGLCATSTAHPPYMKIIGTIK
jgi:hypothetical protein